ncbi:LSU ribosomal protein L44E8 [Nucleospora cyclopteri]
MDNENPQVKEVDQKRIKLKFTDGKLKEISKETIFELLRDIKDPEHPLTLEQLNVIQIDDIETGEIEQDEECVCKLGFPIKFIKINFTPTVPHCSLVGIIGLCLHYQLKKYTNDIWVQIKIKKDSHAQETSYNRQLEDNERVTAAFENEALMEIINECVPDL